MGDKIVRFNKNHKKRYKYKKNLNVPHKRKIRILPIIICVILGASLFGAYSEMKKAPVADETAAYNPYIEDYIPGKTILYDVDVEPPVKDEIWVMYQNLNSADKRVYDMFLDLVEHRGESGYKSSIVLSDATFKSMKEGYFWNIFYAMCYDHPEFFFLELGDSKIHSSYTTRNGSTTYIFEIDPSEEEEKQQIIAFDNATNAFLKDIDLSLPDEEIELQIHDKLIQMVSYDYELFEKRELNVSDLGYTAYGALVENSSGEDNKAVCAGYSRAFEHLLHQAGIPCAFVSGSAKHVTPDAIDNGSHAWNVVKTGGHWYEVDTTWDDLDLADFEGKADAVIEAIESNEAVWFNVCHYYYNKTTKEMENMVATDATVLEIPGYYPYNLRSDTTHIRVKKAYNEEDEIKAFANELVPLAE